MTFILRASMFVQKKIFCEDFSNLGHTLTHITHNGYNFERFSAMYNIKYFSTEDHRKTSTKREIYYGSLTRQIRGLKIFSLLTSVGSLGVQPLLLSHAMQSGNTGAVLGVFACVGFFAVTTPLFLHLITKKYITYLYYDAKEDKYIANTYSLFARTKELVFTPNDVAVPDVTGMFTNCIIKGTPLFLEQKFFHDSSHYIRIMGYDKPIDFKLGNNNSLNQTTTVDAEYKHINKK